MEKYSKNSSLLTTRFYRSVAVGSLIGVAVTVVTILLMALLLSSFELPESAPGVMAAVSIGVGAIISGFVSGKCNGHNGLLTGLVSGTAMYIVFVMIALALGSGVGVSFVTRLIIAVVFSSLGGVLGINLHRKRKYV